MFKVNKNVVTFSIANNDVTLPVQQTVSVSGNITDLIILESIVNMRASKNANLAVKVNSITKSVPKAYPFKYIES